MTLIDKAEALAIARSCPDSHWGPWIAERIAALPARGVGVLTDAAEMLAKEMQAIVAADRWKGRDLSAAPPEKWSHLRPETQQFWIDTATRILAVLEAAPHVNETPKSEHDGADVLTDAAQAREAALWEAWNVVWEAKTLLDAKNALHALITEARDD